MVIVWDVNLGSGRAGDNCRFCRSVRHYRISCRNVDSYGIHRAERSECRLIRAGRSGCGDGLAYLRLQLAIRAARGYSPGTYPLQTGKEMESDLRYPEWQG